jgi:hypothetical protein
MNTRKTIGLRRLALWAALCSITIGGCAREKDRLDEEVRRLCAEDGGVKVYETVVLAEEEYQKLLNRSGELDIRDKKYAKPTDAFFQESTTTYLKKGNPEMWRSEYRLVRRSDGKVLATSVHYARRGGDLPGPWHDSSFSCPDTQANPRMADLAIKKAN